MLTKYIHAAMRETHYEMMEDKRFFATIPSSEGLWADGDSLEGAREQLQDVLEDWILIKVRHGDVLPVIAGVDINPQPPKGGGKHLAMYRDGRKLIIPNPHGGDVIGR